AATARATSSGPERGKQPMTSFQSAGLRFSKYAPVVGTTHSPAMKFLKLSAISRQPSARGWGWDIGTQPQRRRVGTDARQDLARRLAAGRSPRRRGRAWDRLSAVS